MLGFEKSCAAQINPCTISKRKWKHKGGQSWVNACYMHMKHWDTPLDHKTKQVRGGDKYIRQDTPHLSWFLICCTADMYDMNGLCVIKAIENKIS